MTKYAFYQLGSVELGITGTGEYGPTYQWIRATGAGIFINSSSFGTTHKITNVSRCTSYLNEYGALRTDYTAEIEAFVLFQWGILSLGKNTYSGYSTWANALS